MAYATSNPPALTAQPINGPREWIYSSADAAATVDASGYFTNGYDLGIRDGDYVKVYCTATKIWTVHTATVSGTTVNLADGTITGSTTNSD